MMIEMRVPTSTAGKKRIRRISDQRATIRRLSLSHAANCNHRYGEKILLKKNGQIKLRTVRRLEGITRFLFALSLPHSPLDHLILEQAAFQRSIEKRRTLGGGEADELRQPHVGSEQIGAPARELFF